MYQGASLLSLEAHGRGKGFAPSKSSKEIKLLKSQNNFAIHEWNRIWEKLIGLEKDMETNNVPYNLSSTVFSLRELLEYNERALVNMERALIEKDKTLVKVHTSLNNYESSRKVLVSKENVVEENLQKEKKIALKMWRSMKIAWPNKRMSWMPLSTASSISFTPSFRLL